MCASHLCATRFMQLWPWVPNGPGSQMVPGSQMAPGPKWPGSKWSLVQNGRVPNGQVPNGRAPSQMVPKWGPGKHGFAWEWFPKLRLGVLRDPNGLYGTQEAFGRASFPPTLPENGYPRISPISGKLGRVPLYIPYWPFVGCLLALCGC